MEKRAVILFILVVGILSLSLYIPAIIYGMRGDPDCATTYPEITFDYSTWLLWFGIVGLIHIGITFFFATLELCYDGVGIALWVIFYILFVLFSLAWFITGAVLLFSTLVHRDCFGEPIWKFGLALFTIEAAGRCLHLCHIIHDGSK